MTSPRSRNPYRSCRIECNHDLAPGVLVSDLLGSDGPHRAAAMVTALPIRRAPAGLSLGVHLARAG